MFYLFFKLLTKTFSLEILEPEEAEEMKKKNLIDFIHEMFVIFFLTRKEKELQVFRVFQICVFSFSGLKDVYE